MVTLDVKHAIGLDLETRPIEPLPAKPPAPVGAAIHWPGRRPRYYAWGHESGNNCTVKEGRAAVREAYASRRPILGHNFLHFDAPVIAEHFGLDAPRHDRVIDTQAWAFLAGPNERDLGLKPLCEKLLGEPPVERDAVREWVLRHVPGARKARMRWGQHIWRAPGTLVAPYAMGDVEKPRRLASFLLEKVEGMREALDLEQWWLQYATVMERRGVLIAVRRLARDVRAWERSLAVVEAWIRRRIKSPSAPLVGDALADALEKAGLVYEWEETGEPAWNRTPKGRRSTKHADLRLTVTDADLVGALRYYGLLGVYKRTFAEEWLRQARITGGVYTPVQRPDAVIALLAGTSFSDVEDVVLTNLTTGDFSTDVRLAPDGSFAGYVPVREGRNRVRVSALASDGSRGNLELELEFALGKVGSGDAAAELERIRRQNRELEIRRRSVEIEAFRAQQRRDLEIRVKGDAGAKALPEAAPPPQR